MRLERRTRESLEKPLILVERRSDKREREREVLEPFKVTTNSNGLKSVDNDRW